MSVDQYVKCPYCSETVKYNENHLELCTPNYIDETLLWCYSCGEKDKKYSNTQLAKKEDKARCNDCLKSDKTYKFEPYNYLYKDTVHSKSHNGKKLMASVAKINLKEVNELLLLNVNVNYIRQDTIYCPVKHKHFLSYNADGSEKPNIEEQQPNTPLKMCVFRFSDFELSDSERLEIIKIAKQLIKFGALPTEAKKYYESRYPIPVIKEKLYYHFYKVLCD